MAGAVGCEKSTTALRSYEEGKRPYLFRTTAADRRWKNRGLPEQTAWCVPTARLDGTKVSPTAITTAARPQVLKPLITTLVRHFYPSQHPPIERMQFDISVNAGGLVMGAGTCVSTCPHVFPAGARTK